MTLYRSTVISLARTPEKAKAFLDRTTITGLPFEVFQAVDGSKLSTAEALQQGLIAENVELYTPGAIGCAASHRALWQEAHRTNTNLLICEDDVTCRHDIDAQIRAILATPGAWDVILLGYNTNTVLDVKVSAAFDFAGFFSNEYPTAAHLAAFARETTTVLTARLNNAFGLCAYLVSPEGARKLLTLFPMDNRAVLIPGAKVKFGFDAFTCSTLDMLTNTLYPHINAYACIPPLALPLNDLKTSATVPA